MPNETLITEIENVLSEVIRLGGENERSQIVPNLTVQDANPTGLSNYVIVSDDRDGDNIPAQKVGSVVYSDNDLVNVMFLRGGEAIAFQQGSASPNNGIWEIVPSTSTDIYYDKGDVGIGKSVAPDAALEVLDTSQAQLRLTFEEDIKFADFTIDTNHDLTIDPSSTGQITLDSDNVIIGEDLIHNGDTDTKIIFTDDRLSFDAGAINLLRLTETTQDLVEIGDVAGGGDVDINFNNGQMFFDGSSGNLGIGTGATSPEGRLHVQIADASVSPPSISDVAIFEFTAGAGADGISLLFPNDKTGIINFGTPADNDAGQIRYSGPSVATTIDQDTMQLYVGGVETMRLDSNKFIGIGVDGIVSSPEGQIHAYDTISGFLIWEFDGLDATVREVLSSSAGDVLYQLHAAYVLRDSAGAVASGTTDVSNTASVNLTVGGNTVRLRVNANGSIDVARTAGSDTIKVALTLRWL